MVKRLYGFCKHIIFIILVMMVFLTNDMYFAYADEFSFSESLVNEQQVEEQTDIDTNEELYYEESNYEESEDVAITVNDLDLGNYETRMYVGERQLLDVTILPLDAEKEAIYYVSSDESVATVNGMGRIVAVAPGSCEISAICNTVVRGFTLKVIQEELAEVEDLDIGNYRDEMLVGEHQVLSVTPIPIDAENADIEYSSSDEEVATINALGRIIAKAKGRTTIMVRCGSIEYDFKLKVIEEEDIEVTDIDLGVYSDEMTIGDTQMLNITVIPTNATNQKIKYSSSNDDVAEINDLGRIFAVGEGKSKITVSCDGEKKSFRLVVKEKVVVTDIEIGKYEEELEVDERMTLKVKAVPEEAEDRKITFESSDTKVAKISSDGEILGISKGKVTIIIKAGDIEKEIELLVKVPTNRIEVNSTYLIMKRGESFQLDAMVQPYDAEQELTYKSADSRIVSVSPKGEVSAKSLGNTSIIISNGDLSKIVTVIVNEHGDSIDSSPNFIVKEQNQMELDLSAHEKKIIDQLDYHSEIEVKMEECKVLTKPILKKMLETHSILKILGSEYIMTIEGKNILNYENKLKTEIELSYKKNMLEFIINEKEKIPAPVTIELLEDQVLYKYLYLYNDEKEKFQLLDSNDIMSGKIQIDEPGRYVLTNEKIELFSFNKAYIIGGGAITGIGIVIYGISKKRYWFW